MTELEEMTIEFVGGDLSCFSFVLRTSFRDVNGHFRWRISFEKTTQLLAQMEQEVLEPWQTAEAVTLLGRELYRVLLHDEAVKKLFFEGIGRCHDRYCLRIVFGNAVCENFQQREILFALPWEFLHDGHEFLNLDPHRQIVRCVNPHRDEIPLRQVARLHVLVVFSMPNDQELLDGDRELQLLEEAWPESSNLTVTFLRNPSIVALRQTLRNDPSINMLHFIGHGDFDPDKGEGCILFTRPNQATQPISGAHFATMIGEFNTLSLVFFNACVTARASGSSSFNPLNSVAGALASRGFPAVIAMNFSIGDQAALNLSAGLYEALAGGFSIQQVMAEGRLSIFGNDLQRLEWGTPVLFLARKATSQPFVKPLDSVGDPEPNRTNDSLQQNNARRVTRPNKGRHTSRSKETIRDWVDVPEGAFVVGDLLSFAPIPMGTLFIGCVEKYADANEGPSWSFVLETTLYMSQTLVTRQAWYDVMDTEPWRTASPPGAAFSERLPATNIDWQQACHFAASLTRRYPQYHFRLPREGEWEYACLSAGSETCFYQQCRSLDQIAWYRGNADSRAHPVARHEPNALKLYDMYGNVEEWCADVYGQYRPQEPPTSGRETRTGKFVVRGGCFHATAWNCRATRRRGLRATTARNDLGFRLVAEPLA